MPRIAAVATATPPHIITQEQVIGFAKSIFGESRLLKKLLPVFENSLVKKRHLTVDLNWLRQKHDFTETNDLYIQTAVELAQRVTLAVSEKCGISTTDFDVVFFLSTTGLSTPSVDARLFNKIKMNPHIKRIPIWGLGCAAGAGGLARAYDYLKSYPTHRALVIAVELCSLSFQQDKPSKTDIISSAIFGDGAAACAIFGDQVKMPESAKPQPSILGSLSTIYPDSLDVMSWRATSEGFKVQLSRDIPAIVTSLVKNNIEELMALHSLSLRDLTHFVLHPGGAKVLTAYVDGLGISNDSLAHSYGVLNDYGNMSSVTVFFILDRFLKSTEPNTKEHALVGALGPGFSSELVLLKWD